MLYTNTQAFTAEYPWLLDLEIGDHDNKAGCKQAKKVKQDEAKKIKKLTRKLNNQSGRQGQPCTAVVAARAHETAVNAGTDDNLEHGCSCVACPSLPDP